MLPVRWNITPTAVCLLCPCPSCFPLCKLALVKSALKARNKIVSKVVSVPNPCVFPWGVQTLWVPSHCSPLWLCLGTAALLFRSQGLQHLGAGFLSFFFCFLAEPRMACRISIPRPGIEPTLPAVEVQSLNHWTAREVPRCWVSIPPSPTPVLTRSPG